MSGARSVSAPIAARPCRRPRAARGAPIAAPPLVSQAGVGLLALAMATVIALSVCCLAIGNGAGGWTAQARTDLRFRSGWLSYTLNSAPPTSLRTLSAAASVSCIVAAALVAASAALAAAVLGVVCCGGAGGALAALAAPAGALVAAGLCVAYAVSAAAGARTIGATVGRAFVPYPSTGWALGLGSALAWEFAACIACGLPRATRDGVGRVAAVPASLGAAKRSSDAPPAAAAPFTADLDPEVAAALADPRTPAFYGTAGKGKKRGAGGARAATARAAAAAGAGPAAPESAFVGSLASTHGSPPFHAAPPAVEPPPPSALPPPTALGFFAAARDSIKRVASLGRTA